MPIDPSIPLAAQGPQPITLNSIAQIMQMRYQAQQMKQAQAVQNSLAAIYANPANLGPDGMPNAEAIQQIGRVSPQAAQQLITQKATIDEKKAVTSKDQMEAGMSAQKNIQAMVREPALNAYDQALAGGKTPQQAQQIAQKVYADGMDQLFSGGYIPDAMKQQVPMNFDPVRVRAGSLSYKDAQALQQKETAQSDREAYQGAQLELGKERVGIESANLGLRSAEVRQKLEEGAAGEAAAADLSPAAIDEMAERYRQYGTLPSFGMGKQGAAMKRAVINRAADMDKQAGISASDAATTAATGKAGASARSALERSANNIELAEKTALGSADMVEKASANYERTGSPLANRSLNAFRSNVLGDPKYQKLQNDITTFKNEYVKVMTGSGQATDSARAEADHLVNVDMSHEQLLAGMSEMKKEMTQVRESAIAAARQSSSGQISNKAPKTVHWDDL